MKKFHKIFNHFKSNLIIFFCLELIPLSINSTLEEVQESLKEVAYSYYMRETNIQYNLGKRTIFPPEEATLNNKNFLICSYLVINIFKELINITVTLNIEAYVREHLGSPEIIAFSFINEKNITELRVYSSNGSYKTKLNPTINDIIPLIQIGDVLTYTGHTKIIYDIEKDKNGTVTDGIIMQSTEGGSGNWVKTKICPQLLKLNGATFKSFFSNLFYFERFNKKFKKDLMKEVLD